jgi:hypothetical protein
MRTRIGAASPPPALVLPAPLAPLVEQLLYAALHVVQRQEHSLGGEAARVLGAQRGEVRRRASRAGVSARVTRPLLSGAR